MASESIDPQNIFNYRLSQLVKQIGAPVVRLCEGRYGITRREWRFLAMLARDGAQSPSALAEHSGLDRARTSRVVGSLVAKELAERAVLPGDKRRAQVRLSARGLALVQELYPQVAAINARALAGLTPCQRETLDALIALLTRQTAHFNDELLPQYHANRRSGRAGRPAWRAPAGVNPEDG